MARDFAGEPLGLALESSFMGFGSTDQEDMDRGMRIITQYQNYMKSLYKDYQLTLVDLINFYKSQTGGRLFPNMIGAAANVGGIDGEVSDYQANNAMWTLAVKGAGKIPTSWNAFTSVLSDTVSDPWSLINFTSAVAYAAQKTGETVVDAIEEGGETLIETAKTGKDLISVANVLIWPLVGLLIWSTFRNRDTVGEKLLSGATKVAGAATGGVLSLGGAATKKALKAMSNSKRRKKR